MKSKYYITIIVVLSVALISIFAWNALEKKAQTEAYRVIYARINCANEILKLYNDYEVASFNVKSLDELHAKADELGVGSPTNDITYQGLLKGCFQRKGVGVHPD